MYHLWCPGPCLTTAVWRCLKNSSQWQRSFQWKLHSHWLKFLRQRHVVVVRQGPGTCCDAAPPVSSVGIHYLFTLLQLYVGFKSHHYVPRQLYPWLATWNKPRILDAGAGTGLVGEQVDPSVINCNLGRSMLPATGNCTGKSKSYRLELA